MRKQRTGGRVGKVYKAHFAERGAILPGDFAEWGTASPYHASDCIKYARALMKQREKPWTTENQNGLHFEWTIAGTPIPQDTWGILEVDEEPASNEWGEVCP